jgi:hypothetical protein
MNKTYNVRITSGTSPGPYNIYYNTINPLNVALLTGTETPATGLTITQMTTGVGVIIPDTSTSIILYNVDCENNITEIITSTPEPTTNTFSDVPFGGGTKGALFVTQGSDYSVILTGSPFSMSPFQVTPTSINPSTQECNNCKSVINFINTERTENIISFTLGGTSNASAFTGLTIIDNLGTSYSGTFQNGSNNIGTTPDNKIISFNIGSQKGRVFKFLGGEVNLQFI